MDEQVKKQSKLPWIIVGILLLAVIGGGVYVYLDMNKTQDTNSSTQVNGARGNRSGMMNNPALRAATELLRLEQDQKLALTGDQKSKLIPIIQDLKNTPNTSQQVLQDKANAIQQVLTTDQKNFLSQAPTGNGQWGGQRRNGQGGTPGQGQGGYPGQGQGGNYGGQGQRPAQGQGQGNRQFDPSTLYDRVLQALQK